MTGALVMRTARRVGRDASAEAGVGADADGCCASSIDDEAIMKITAASTCSFATLILRRALDEHDIRVFLKALEDDLAAVGRNIEIPNVEVRRQVRQRRSA